MGFHIIDAATIDLSQYNERPLGSAGMAESWLLALLAEGSGHVGFVKRETSVVAALKRAALKLSSITFEVPKYEVTRDKSGKVTSRKRTYNPPKSERMGAVFTRAQREGSLLFDITRLDTENDAVSAESREMVKVTVK